jgi:Histidine phosphatase superfamily (branch 1)
MCVFNRVPKHLFIATLVVMTAHGLGVSQALAQTQPISIRIVRHAEADGSQPTIPLTAAGRQRADVLVQTLRGVKFTPIFTSHTTRTRQMVEGIAAVQVCRSCSCLSPARGSMGTR